MGNNIIASNIGFGGCSSLESVSIENGSIADNAFGGCNNIKEVYIGNGITSIGKKAFYGCSGITGDLIIPDSVISVGEEAFYNCGYTGDLIIGTGLKNVGSRAFQGLTKITGKVIIPNNLSGKVDSMTFAGIGYLSGWESLTIDIDFIPPRVLGSTKG